ncbi:hypothetical protein ACJJTC_003152 [Scirpophaga incertulas]
MDKAFEIQKQVRNNVESFQSYLTDLKNWESEMKRKEAAIKGGFEQDLPPIRSKLKKVTPVVTEKKPEKRISSIDYRSWDRFDADKACEEVDMAEVGPSSLDCEKSEKDKQDKLRDEAQHEKERGNSFVKQEKWDDAISCYSRAIELVKDDAIYYANRGLCYLKKDRFHQAESDCTEALKLDPSYVKAYQRRATARERLGSLRSASQDLTEVLKLEPSNNLAKRQLEAIKARMGTKGAKSKSSPCSTPTLPNKESFTKAQPQAPTLEELAVEANARQLAAINCWREGVGEQITVIKPVKKPPHLRSKRPLKSVTIQEIPIGKASPEKPPTRLTIVDYDDICGGGDSNNNDSNKHRSRSERMKEKNKDRKNSSDGDKAKSFNIASPESIKLIIDMTMTEKDYVQKMVAPMNSVQFMAEWKKLKGRESLRSHYLRKIEPSKIPSIFENALESEVLSEVIIIMNNYRVFFKSKIAAYLRALSRVKRFATLAYFLSVSDKTRLQSLLEYCKNEENITEKEIAELKHCYEI